MSCECNNGGLKGLMGSLLAAGSQIRVTFTLGSVPTYSIEDITSTIEGCLYNSGAFTFVSATVQAEGVLYNARVTVAVETYFDFAQLEDVGGYIHQQLQNCFPELQIVNRSSVTLDYVPDAVAGNPNVQQPNANSQADKGGCPAGTVPVTRYWGLVKTCEQPTVARDSKTKCDWDSMDFSDYLACELGIKPAQALAVGVGVGLLIVIGISKVAK